MLPAIGHGDRLFVMRAYEALYRTYLWLCLDCGSEEADHHQE